MKRSLELHWEEENIKKTLLITGIVLAALIVLFIIIPVPDSGTKETTSEFTPENKIEEASVVEEEPVEEKEPEIIEPTSTDEPEVQETINTNEDSEWLYNIIPYSTYESGGDDLHLYINLVWNDDDSIDLYGFGYSYGEVAEDYEVSVHLTPDPDYEDFYLSDFRNFSVGVMDTYIGVMSDGDEAGHSFSGDFSLVTDGEEEFSGDVVELRYADIPDFFRNTTNVNSIFKCNLYYSNFASYLGNDYHYLYYIDESGSYISFVIYAKADDPKFFGGDLVTVTGVYTDQYDANADIVIDAISMELFN